MCEGVFQSLWKTSTKKVYLPAQKKNSKCSRTRNSHRLFIRVFRVSFMNLVQTHSYNKLYESEYSSSNDYTTAAIKETVEKTKSLNMSLTIGNVSVAFPVLTGQACSAKYGKFASNVLSGQKNQPQHRTSDEPIDTHERIRSLVSSNW